MGRVLQIIKISTFVEAHIYLCTLTCSYSNGIAFVKQTSHFEMCAEHNDELTVSNNRVAFNTP